MQQFPKFTPTRNSTCFSSSAHHQEFIHCTLSNGICHTGTVHTAFEQDQYVPFWSCSKAVYKPLWHIPVPSEQWINSWWWAEELSETCRVSCRSKFGRLVHLVCLIINQFVTMHGHVNATYIYLWTVSSYHSILIKNTNKNIKPHSYCQSNTNHINITLITSRHNPHIKSPLRHQPTGNSYKHNIRS